LPQWEAANGLMPAGELGEYLFNLDDADVPGTCHNMQLLINMIYDAITLPAHQARTAAELWRLTNGDRLLSIAEDARTPCRNDYTKAALLLATNIPHAPQDPADFAAGSGLGKFCRTARAEIRAVIAADTPWTYNVGWGMNAEREGRTRAFAANLPMYCSNALDTFPLREVAVQQYVMRLRFNSPQNHPFLNVRRNLVFTDSLAFFTGPVANVFGQLPDVRFTNEPGIDAGGVRRDWWANVNRAVFTQELTDPAGGLFKLAGGQQYYDLDLTKPFVRDRYVAAGRMLAFSLVNRLPNGVALPEYFWAALMHGRITAADIQIDRPGEYAGIRDVQRDGQAAIRAIEMLSPDEPCPSVEEYVQQLLDLVVSPAALERIGAIRQGFEAVVPLDPVRLNFKPLDMRSFVFGDPQIDVEDLRANTDYDNNQETRWLWQWLGSVDNAMKRKYLQFVTGLSQVPLGGFAGLNRRMRIVRSHMNDLAARSHTCFFQLDLPQYRTYAELAEWMAASVSSDGFGMG
jgi:hypothetical protein